MPPSPISSLPRPSWLGDVLGVGAAWEGVPESCPPESHHCPGPSWPNCCCCCGWFLWLITMDRRPFQNLLL